MSRNPLALFRPSPAAPRPARRARRPARRARRPALERLEARNLPTPVVVQPDLTITQIGEFTLSLPAQLAFGPDGRLYASQVFGGDKAPSAVSFRYDPAGGLTDERVEASTGGALGIAFGPVRLGDPRDPGTVTATGMYLTDAAGGGNSNLRVLTRDANGVWGGPAGGTDTVIVRNIPAGYHQPDQIVIKDNPDGTSTLYVGIGVRTVDGVYGYPDPGSARDPAWGGTISEIKDLNQVNGLVDDSAGFGFTGDAGDNGQPDYSNDGPVTSAAANKLVVHSSGTRNPFGLALDGNGDLWFTNNFNRSEADGTFDGTIDPATHILRGFTTGDPLVPADLRNNVYDQLFKAAPMADYGYDNSNWRNDAANDNPDITSSAAVDAGFYDFAHNGVRSVTYDNLNPPGGQFEDYDQSDINHLRGLGPSCSADGFAFYTAQAFPKAYWGQAFITRWSQTITDARGQSVTYADLVAVDPTTGNVRQIARDFVHPLVVLEDGSGSLLVADFGDGAVYRLSAAGPAGAGAQARDSLLARGNLAADVPDRTGGAPPGLAHTAQPTPSLSVGGAPQALPADGRASFGAEVLGLREGHREAPGQPRKSPPGSSELADEVAQTLARSASEGWTSLAGASGWCESPPCATPTR
jgi:hypothetical protein